VREREQSGGGPRRRRTRRGRGRCAEDRVSFVQRPNAPSEEEQYALYETMTRMLGKRPLTVRTLDAGGDKAIPYLSLEREENPFLGVRGYACPEQPDVFSSSSGRSPRGRARFGENPSSHGLRVEEVRRARELLAKAVSELAGRGCAFDGRVPLGIMIEVPSAVMMAERIAPEVAFFSIGTNDLVQYTLAADRTNPNVAELGDALHPRAQDDRTMREGGTRRGHRVSVCGEMARDPPRCPSFSVSESTV